MKYVFPIVALFIAVAVWADETKPVVRAHLVGENFGTVDTNIVVTAEKQRIFHFHSDVEGGGTWYDTHISTELGIVTILERDSIGNPCKGGSKVETKESIYRLSVDEVAGEPIELRNGNRVVLQVENKQPASAQAPDAIDIVRLHANGETTLNGLSVDIEQLSEKFARPTLIISSDKSIRHKTVIAVLNEAKKAGITNVSFATEAP
jgi:hypothetical protein